MYNQAALPQTLLTCCHEDKYVVMEIAMLSWRYIYSVIANHQCQFQDVRQGMK